METAFVAKKLADAQRVINLRQTLQNDTIVKYLDDEVTTEEFMKQVLEYKTLKEKVHKASKDILGGIQR